jgi:Aromatic-ring-opening dioxygenase LigAB, LigA subunit
MIRTSYPLNKLLTAVARQHAIKQRLNEEELTGYDLTPDERAALTTGDIKRLYDLGANPYLIRRVFRPNFPI